ncbi:integrase, catalytic region, zinc finger, CCHC-type containing protein, partial [Tanacetum coccineum]
LKAQLVGNKVVRVKIPKCMSWLDAYDEPIGDLDMMEDNVDNSNPQSSAADWDSVFQLQGIWACSKGMEDTDDEPEDQELEAHYMYMEKIQEVISEVADNSRPIFEYLKKAQSANPRLYDIGCYNDNLALMFALESNETIRLTQESRSKLRDLIKPFDYKNLNNLYELFVPQREKSVEQKTKKPIVVPNSTREPKRKENQSVVTPLKKTVAIEFTNQKPRSTTRKQYEHVSMTCRWWYSKIATPGYKWKPKSSTTNVKSNVSLPLGIKSRTTNISEHMTLRNSTLSNTLLSSNPFATRTVKFGNDQIAPILGYGDLVQGNVTIKRVYCVEGLNHNLFSVGQFCDADLEVAFRKSTCYIRDLKGNDLLTGSRGIDLYSITLQDTSSPNPICLMAKASSSQAWLWHRHLSHLNFDTINLLSKYDIVTYLQN